MGPNLADNQFGFGEGRSMVVVIMRVKALTTGDALSVGRVVVLVSLDFDAFNSCTRVQLQGRIECSLEHSGINRCRTTFVAQSKTT